MNWGDYEYSLKLLKKVGKYMDGINDNLAITNGLGFGVAIGAAQIESGLKNHGKMTEYEKEQMLAQQNRVMDQEEKERFMQRLEDGTY